MNPHTKQLNIYGDAYDPGVNGSMLSRENITCLWNCINLNTQQPCFMVNGEFLNLTEFKNKELHVKDRRL